MPGSRGRCPRAASRATGLLGDLGLAASSLELSLLKCNTLGLVNSKDCWKKQVLRELPCGRLR